MPAEPYNIKRRAYMLEAIVEELEAMDRRLAELEAMHRPQNRGTATLCANQMEPSNRKRGRRGR